MTLTRLAIVLLTGSVLVGTLTACECGDTCHTYVGVVTYCDSDLHLDE